MNRNEAGLPVSMLAGHTAVAALAAIGLLSVVPIPFPADFSLIAVPALTAVMAGGLVLAGKRLVEQARSDALRDAATDPFTGLATPTAAERVLELEFAAAQRGRPLTVVLIRIEQFSQYRVEHGRVVAKQLLRLAGRGLRKHRRSMHVTAHYGEAEGIYLSILSGMDVDGALVYARRVRRELMTLPGVPKPPAVSVGIVAYDLSMTSPAALLDHAERALERGAEAGGKVAVMGQLATDSVE